MHGADEAGSVITKTVGSLARQFFMTWSEIYCIDLAINLHDNRPACSLLLDVYCTSQLHSSFLHCYGWSSYHSNKENKNGTMHQEKCRDVLHSACL